MQHHPAVLADRDIALYAWDRAVAAYRALFLPVAVAPDAAQDFSRAARAVVKLFPTGPANVAYGR